MGGGYAPRLALPVDRRRHLRRPHRRRARRHHLAATGALPGPPSGLKPTQINSFCTQHEWHLEAPAGCISAAMRAPLTRRPTGLSLAFTLGRDLVTTDLPGWSVRPDWTSGSSGIRQRLATAACARPAL